MWAGEDGVPRPDIHRETLWWWSALGGLLGLDHFYARSPWTGFAKMFTVGGFGLWWLWDVCQIAFEKERVVRYGLSTPFDIVTGIAQGMITEKPTLYKSDGSFGFWVLFKLLLGPSGISDILVENRVWFGLFKMIIIAVTITLAAGAFNWDFWSIIGLFIVGPFAIANLYIWVSDIYRIVKNPIAIMKEGLPTPDYAYNTYQGIKNWWKKKDGTIEEGDQEIVGQLDIANGPEGILPSREGMTASALKSMFEIQWNPSSKQKGGGDDDEEMKVSNPILAFAMQVMQVMWDNVRETFSDIAKAIGAMINPTGAAMAESTKQLAKLQVKAAEAALAAGNKMPNLPSMSLPSMPTEMPNLQSMPNLPSMPNLQSMPNLPSMPSKLPSMSTLSSMIGGARHQDDSLSTEAQIMAAAIVALIAGGSLKGVIDYLMVE